MEENQKIMLIVKSSRISSFKSLFFPMEYHFYEDNSRIKIVTITKNWIGQKTQKMDFATLFRAKGVVLRKLYFLTNTNGYGRFWFNDVRRVKKLIEKYVPETSRIEWSDAWF